MHEPWVEQEQETTERAAFRLLVVEDDYDIRTGLRDFLELQGLQVCAVRDAEAALQCLDNGAAFDLVLLDVMLPKRSGFDLLQSIRQRGIALPVILLTARCETKAMLKGFELGAADYIIKPFNADLLLARVHAVLRRTTSPRRRPMHVYRFGDLEVNFSTYETHRGSRAVHLTKHEYKLLRYLLEHRGEVVSRDALLRDVWGVTGDVDTRTVDRHIASLRKKIEPAPGCPIYIETVYGSGYRFAD
jgi:DNA-binding response OmpR family regulator